MSRRTDIQAEEAGLNSPLRRSSRRAAVTSSPAPASLSSRRNSQSQTEATETKPIKTRRASQSQENVEKNEIIENKAAPRGRRASTAKEDTEEKTESTRIRSRRSSAATEPATEEPEKKQFITRRRKSTAAEEQTEPESVKSIRSRRSSVKDTVVEEDTAKRPIRSRRNSTKEETKEDPPKKVLRSRRGSAAEENPEIETKEKKPPTRGRRSSTDKLDDEPDTKIAKLTPIKSKRRLSVTENTASLEPIVELESETKARKSTSPQNPELKKAVVNLTDIKVNKEVKTNLDLSTIDESSFTEESLNKSTSEKKSVTPRKSPRLNKEKKVNNLNDSLTPSKSSAMDKESVDKEYSPKQIEEEANKNVGEDKSEEHIENESANESLEKASSSLCKKLLFESETTEEINTVELAEAKEISIKEEENVQTGSLIQDKSDAMELAESKEIDIKKEENVQTEELIQDKSGSTTQIISQSELEIECDQEKEYHKQLALKTNKTSNPDATASESDESFKFQLQVSDLDNPDDNVKDDLNTSKNSNSSDKENIEINSTKYLNESNVNVTGTPKKIKSIIESSNHNIQKDIQNVVGRVSNVFRPNMKENSFMEPMEVDESFLDITQIKKSFDLEESVIENVPPVVSTPIVKRCVEEILNKEDLGKLKGDEEGIDQNEHKQIEVSKTDQLNEESEENVSEVITIDSEVTLEDSEAVYISKQEYTNVGQILDDVSKEITNVCNLETIVDTKTSCRQAAKIKQNRKITTEENITNLKNGSKVHDDGCESPLSEEELERKPSDNPSEGSLLEITEAETEETSRIRSPQHQQEDVKLESKSPQQITSDEIIKSEEKEYLSETLETEAQEDKNNSSMKPESPQTQYANIDKLENETKRSPRRKSPQPDHQSDKLKPQESARSTSPPSDNENLEMEQVSERISSRELISPLSNKTDMPESEMENLDEDETCPRRSKSPQPIQEGVTEEKEIPLTPKESLMSELNDSSKQILESGSSPKKLSDLESEPEVQTLSPVKKKDSVRESPKFKELGKMNISEDYEFEMPSDEEEVNKSRNLILEEDTVKDKCEVENAITEQVQKSPVSSPLKRKSFDSEVEQSKKIKLAEEIEENVQDDSEHAAGCDETSSDELPAPEEMMITEAKVEPTNETVMGEDNDESATDDSIARDNLASTQSIPESNENKSENDNKLSVTETEIVTQNFADELSRLEEIPSEIENSKEHISVKNEEEDGSISAVDTNKKAITSIEMKTTEKAEATLENISDVKKMNKTKKKSKTIKKSSVKSSEIDVSVENASSSNVKTIHTSEEFDIEKSDCQDVIKDSSEGKKNKKKSKKQIDNPKQTETCKEKKSQLDETTADASVINSKSAQKKSKKAQRVDRKENNYDDSVEKMKTVKKADKYKVPVADKNKSIESDKKKKSKKSVGASNEDVFSSSATEEKAYKTQKKADSSASETKEDNENQNKKSQKKTKNADLNQVSSPKKQKMEGLDASIKSKLDKYLFSEISKQNSEYSTDEEDNEEVNDSIEEEDNDEVNDSIEEDNEEVNDSVEEEDNEEENDFFCTMAEEGEEDTPSDDSNDIVDEGESVGFSDAEVDLNDTYDLEDPFICDEEEEEELLSGEEYDLGNEKKKKKEKKSRIIQLDDCDDEIIKIKRKEKPVKKNKRSRIISISDSSDSDMDSKNNAERFLNNSLEEISGSEQKEETNDVIILEEKSTPIKFSNNQMIPVLDSFNTSTVESSTRKKRKSIIIHENINVTDFKNTEYGGKIASMVDDFCDSIHDGEISLNFSLEHAVDTAESSKYEDVPAKKTKGDRHFKLNLQDSYDSRESEKEKDSKKKQKVSVSLDNIEDSDELEQSSSNKRRISASLDNLRTSKSKKNKTIVGKKKNLVKTSHSKKKAKSQKRRNGTKPPTNSPEDLQTKTFSIMDQLITDVKNRPVRTIKPSTTVINMNGSWISEVADVKPSTTLTKRSSATQATRTETAEYKPGKIHPKDFRSKMLYDSSRVRRVDTKTLLRKKGAYF